MKRILAVLLMVMLFVAVMPATSLAASKGDTTMYHVATQRDELMLRAGPGTSYTVLAKLGKNMALTKLSGDEDGWCRVRTMNGMSGYAYSSYVKRDAYADVDTKRDGLNVRPKPNTKKKEMYSIPHGTKDVVIQAVNGNWAKVNWNKKGTGYASLSYLKWSR